MSTKKTVSNVKTGKRLLSYLTPYKGQTIGIIILLLIIMGISVLTPKLLQLCIDVFIVNKDIYGLIIMGALLTGIGLISMLLSRVKTYHLSKITNTVLIDIRKDVFSHLQTLDFNYFDNLPVGKILSRVIGDVTALQNLLNNSIVNLIPNLFTIVLVTFMMLTMHLGLAIICLVILPLLLCAMVFIEIKSHKLWHDFRDARSNILGFSHEALAGIRVTQAFSEEGYVKEKFDQHLDTHSNSFLHAIRVQDYFWPVVTLCRGCGICVVLTASFYLNQRGSVSIGTIMAFILYIEMLWQPIMNLSAFYNALITNLSAAERIFELLDTKSSLESISHTKAHRIEGEILFKDVSFSYDNDDKHALKDMSFHIQAGEKIALVGETGSGKTTITNLISKFYTPSSGKIFIDGVDLNDISADSLRNQMGIMLQDSFLFSSSIKENISYGKLDATDEEIIAAAKSVHAHEFISCFKNGYDTDVNERGSKLSQGQRQLIAFARALIANPKILILDEATANIDTHTEKLVQQGLSTLMANRTSIIIAHRLSTIRDCDKIFVLSNGRVIECGTHDNLLQKQGYYYDLYSAQYKFLD